MNGVHAGSDYGHRHRSSTSGSRTYHTAKVSMQYFFLGMKGLRMPKDEVHVWRLERLMISDILRSLWY